MKKRRVLALLLALSLAVSTNGMTVFATEAGELTASVESPVGESTEDVQDGTEQTDTAEDDADDEQDIDSEDTEKNDEAGGDSAEDQTGKDDDGTNGGEASGEETDTDGQDSDTADIDDETLSENDLSDEEEIKELPDKTANEVRMMTFTDDTGLLITYDANAAANYKYTVDENGVLIGVKNKETGEAIDFSGDVVLTQPEEGDKYTSIAANSNLFQGNTKVTYVKLPDGVTSIAENTFKGCTALKGAYLPSTVTLIGASAFESCTAMTQIAVPKAVISIGNKAFKDDAKLYMVYMKDVDYSALASIGDSAFEGCSALAEFCSDTEFFLPTSLKRIGASAFKDCSKIKKLDLDTARLTTMGESAFEGCTGLTDAVICRTLAEIPTNAFKGCIGLASLVFSSQESMTISENAFYGCYSLRQVVIPLTVAKVSDHAFEMCTNLNRVVVENALTEIGNTKSFPAGDTNGTLYLVGAMYISANSPSRIYNYYRQLSSSQQAKTVFIRTDVNNNDYFKYTVVDNNGDEHADGKIPGGQIWVGEASENHSNKNINTLNDGKGVKSDGAKYYVYYKADNGYSLVDGSIRSNGEIVQKDNKGYYITMPLGGTVITAEFRRNDSSDKIVGQQNDITVEFSNGEPILPGGVDYGVELKVGQTTRMFLIDRSGVPISSSQIKKISSDKSAVAKVSNTGLITAVGKGTAKIQVELTGGDGNHFLVERTIKVVEADIDSISLVASNYDPIIEITGDIHGIQTAAVSKNVVASAGLSITLRANAYTEAKEGVAKELTWKSSDTTVAAVKKASTTSADSSNVVEIKKGSEGEATITVTAKVNSKKTVTQKFVVSVQNQIVKLASSAVTVNPNLMECGELELISSYGASLSDEEFGIYKREGNSYLESDFQLKRKVQQSGNNKSCRYGITLYNSDIKDGKYNVFVCLKNGSKDETMPLTITVKRSVPAPTVKFNTKKTKFNLFYKNGGTGTDDKPVTVTTEVTKLGNVKLSKVELCPLTEDKVDDQLFLENFEIVNNSEDLAKGIITIRKKNKNLEYTQAKKPAVTGYLKLYYEGYDEKVAKKVKVTMPTVTTAPAYVLDRTSETYRVTASTQHETLKLLDKKTKQKIIFNENVKLPKEKCETDNSVIQNVKLENSEITFDVLDRPMKDKAKFVLINPTEWDTDKDGKDRELSYTFNVKVTSSEPTIKTDQTVTLNLNYPEVEGAFGLKSNQKDTVIAEHQDFTAKSTARNRDEYDKFKVEYENGNGTVKIKSSAAKPASGTYTWSCKPIEKQGQTSVELNKITTLTVKVVDTKPVVKLGKDSLVLNRAAYTETDSGRTYEDIAEIPLKVTGKPEGYKLATNIITTTGETEEVGTKIECTTKNESEAANQFVWTLEDVKTVDGKLVDGKLSVAFKNGGAIPSKKTYAFKMTARYVQQVQEGDTPNVVEAKPMTFNVKVDDNTDISVTFSTKGKLNLVDREGEYTTKNTLIYTPTLKNVRGKISAAWIYDGDDRDEVSKYFDISLEEDGKLYVTPKKTPVNSGTGEDGDNTGGDNIGGDSTGGDTTSGNEGTGGTEGGGDETNELENSAIVPQSEMQDHQYAELENNKQYRVKIEVKVEGYNGGRGPNNGIISKPITIKTAQVLPKVTTDKTTLDVYLSNKEYDATFTVIPQEGAAGIIEEIKFNDDDEVPNDAFKIIYEKQADGSLKVIVHLKEAVAYKCNSTNKVKMYVKFKGQGTNTAGTLVNMSIRVNK